MNMPQEAIELIDVGSKLGIEVEPISQNESKHIIEFVIKKFNPFKVRGHLGIGRNSITLPIESYEFSYMKKLPQEDGYIFFEQKGEASRETVIKIKNLRLLGKILENSFGMEYFLTDTKMNFLVAVNWYAIEIAGKFSQLDNQILP